MQCAHACEQFMLTILGAVPLNDIFLMELSISSKKRANFLYCFSFRELYIFYCCYSYGILQSRGVRARLFLDCMTQPRVQYLTL